MNILGMTGPALHDNSAALFVDGELVAAAEEERFVRIKHAKRRQPVNAIKFCLAHAGIAPHEIDAVAYPYVHIGLASPARWYYARRHWYEPARALRALFDGNRKGRRKSESVLRLLDELGIGSKRVRFVPVEHHLAHASSAYHLSGFREKTAIVSIDGKGEYATTFFGYGENGRIHKIKEFYDPDSLGWFYGAMTEYLGFEIQDGEYKVMGMAPYGDPLEYDFSRLIRHDGAHFRVNTRLVNVIGRRRYRANGKEYSVSPEFVRWLGPARNGDDIDEPYVHYAAATQRLLGGHGAGAHRPLRRRHRPRDRQALLRRRRRAQREAQSAPAGVAASEGAVRAACRGRRRDLGRRGVVRGDEPRRAGAEDGARLSRTFVH